MSEERGCTSLEGPAWPTDMNYVLFVFCCADLGAALFACAGHVLGGGGRSWWRSMCHAYPKLTVLYVYAVYSEFAVWRE
eukprot:3910979-Prymnesium_polylepis.2